MRSNLIHLARVETYHEPSQPDLRELRKERGLTQEALAEAADLSGNYISELELGQKVPSLTILVRLGQALEVGPRSCWRISVAMR